MANDASSNDSKPAEAGKNSPPIQIWMNAARECFSDWMTDLGLVINVVAIFALAVAVFE
jgi:hypothetical protein